MTNSTTQTSAALTDAILTDPTAFAIWARRELVTPNGLLQSQDDVDFALALRRESLESWIDHPASFFVNRLLRRRNNARRHAEPTR